MTHHDGEPYDRHQPPSKLLTAGLALVWVAGLYFSWFFYLLLQLEVTGIFGTRRGPMDPAFTAFTITGMSIGILVPAIVSYLLLRSWRRLAVVATLGVAIFITAMLLVLPGLLWS